MNEELNKKLAEWAGFEKGKGVKTFRKEGGTLYTETNRWWLTPIVGRYRGEWENLPNFTESLDACFKWLVPMLTSFLYQYTVTLTSVRGKSYCQLYGHTDNPYIPKRIDNEAETPALALCLAIEQLVDSEVTDE